MSNDPETVALRAEVERDHRRRYHRYCKQAAIDAAARALDEIVADDVLPWDSSRAAIATISAAAPFFQDAPGPMVTKVEPRQFALDAAEHIIEMMKDGNAESDCLSEGADVILEAAEKIAESMPSSPAT
jgi:hypothetical protein